jgi:hypothetical protein
VNQAAGLASHLQQLAGGLQPGQAVPFSSDSTPARPAITSKKANQQTKPACNGKSGQHDGLTIVLG